jgi:hyperosmotically inducible periplasmic protein
MKEFRLKSMVRPILLVLFAAFLFSTSAALVSAADKSSDQAARGSTGQAWLKNEVRHQLVLLAWYSVFDNLEYRVEGAKVTLTGQVVQPVTKDNAGKVVKSIEGVQSVDNQIQVLPLSPMDDQIRRAEFSAIYSYPSFQHYSNMAVAPIHIIVNGGHVTLEGVVDNQPDKDAANIRANGVPNVFSVTNNLRVQKAS